MQRFFLLLLLLPAITLAQPSDPLLKRAEDVQKMLNNTIPPDDLFRNDFFAQVPLQQIKEIVRHFNPVMGTIQRSALVKREGTHTGRFAFTGSKGMSLEIDLAVDAMPPHKIIGILFNAPMSTGAATENLDVLLAELKKLPGTVNFILMKLPERRIIASVNPEKLLAIGSTFKLYILGTLMSQIAEGKALWGTVISTDTSISGGGGRLASWPHGSAVTLHTLATLMISESDNAATDHLLRYLGRERVEQQVAAMGHLTPQRMTPLLATWEAFKLKSIGAGKQRQQLTSASELERRDALLQLEKLEVDYGGASGPVAIDTVEWFASASDLCRAMEVLSTMPDVNNTGRNVMAINSGLMIDRTTWNYIGYKGGSEPGVLNLTFLLKSQSGEWFALSAGWNNPAIVLDNDRFLELLQRILYTGPW